MSAVEQADRRTKRSSAYHRFLKKRKIRLERRRARGNPEAPAGYRRFKGYET